MRIGIPKEIKTNENRVGLTPQNVRELVHHGHEVWVGKDAGQGIAEPDAAYVAVGSKVVDDAADIFANCDMIVKVKEPQQSEYTQLRKNQILFTYLHLAPDSAQTQGLLASGCIAIAYETVTSPNHTLPLLAPMSEVAGRMAPQVGAYTLQKSQGGLGVLLGGVPGVAPASVVILGGGVAGMNACKIALGMGANVTILERNLERLRYLDDLFSQRGVQTRYSSVDTVQAAVMAADLVIGTVLIPGANAPKLIPKSLLGKMKKGAVIVDVAIDQGGCTETSRPTTHENPTYEVDGVIHYCVANMPGGVPRTSTYALNNATLPFVLALANKGAKQALLDDSHLRNGLNVCHGHITQAAVAQAQNLPLMAAEAALALI